VSEVTRRIAIAVYGVKGEVSRGPPVLSGLRLAVRVFGVIVHVDEEALQSSLQRLRQAGFDADVAGVLKRAVDAVHRVFGCSGAGIMFVTEDGYLSYVAATDEAGRQLEQAQAAAGQGPCYDSYVYAREMVSTDLRADSRWPALAAHLPPGVRAVAGIPVMLAGIPVGTLNVYRHEPADWDESHVRALRAYGDLVAEALGAALAAQDHSVLSDQLRYALDYRVVIERGVGYLIGSRGLDAATAFSVLRKRARDSQRRVADVAADLLGGAGSPPDAGSRNRS
jgi:GAF domain-containing protein